MPELPEVETVKRVLEPQLSGRVITKIVCPRPEIIAHPHAEVFFKKITGAKITGMGRRGKFILINLEHGATIIVHLRMTGQLVVTPATQVERKHTHIIFQLDNQEELRFIDPRRFGRLWLQEAGEEDNFSGISKLGPEPFAKQCNAAYLAQSMGHRQKAIKECLLDQSIIAGIGNIYADEILFAAQICPTTPAASLTKKDWQNLARIIPKILKIGIEADYMTKEEYLAAEGKWQHKMPVLKAYGHEHDPCPRCQTPLVRVIIAGRSSCYCPHCQRQK